VLNSDIFISHCNNYFTEEASNEMRATATLTLHVTWSVCLSHRESRKNDWTDWDVEWGGERGRGPSLQSVKKSFWVEESMAVSIVNFIHHSHVVIVYNTPVGLYASRLGQVIY